MFFVVIWRFLNILPEADNVDKHFPIDRGACFIMEEDGLTWHVYTLI